MWGFLSGFLLLGGFGSAGRPRRVDDRAAPARLTRSHHSVVNLNHTRHHRFAIIE